MHDVKLLDAILDRVVMESPSVEALQNLSADAGYKGVPAWNAVVSHNYQPHFKQRREDARLKRSEPGYKARRWVVERTHSWLNRFRTGQLRENRGQLHCSFIAGRRNDLWRQTISTYG